VIMADSEDFPDSPGFYDVDLATREEKAGRTIYSAALYYRRGFRDDQLGIEDGEIWKEIFGAIGQSAFEATHSDQLIEASKAVLEFIDMLGPFADAGHNPAPVFERLRTAVENATGAGR